MRKVDLVIRAGRLICVCICRRVAVHEYGPAGLTAARRRNHHVAQLLNIGECLIVLRVGAMSFRVAAGGIIYPYAVDVHVVTAARLTITACVVKHFKVRHRYCHIVCAVRQTIDVDYGNLIEISVDHNLA